LGGVKEMGWLVSLASERLGRKIGAVGLQEETIRLGLPYDVAEGLVLGIGHRTGD
jgi:hypothetical protein